MSPARGRSRARRGVSPVEVIVVLAIVLVFVLVVLTLLPRSRENARLVGCTNNLGRIGQALLLYENEVGHLPIAPAIGQPGPGPLATLARQFGLGYFEGGEAAKTPPGGPPEPRLVRGFACGSDPNVQVAEPFPAPSSYRANAGPGADGLGGPFSPGVVATRERAEAARGQDFTAAMAERLVGSGAHGFAPPNDYRLVPGPVGSSPCPESPDDTRRTDAGASWAGSDWASGLYNHAMTPNASPSCIATDGRTARMGASSGHAGRVNVLMLGGSVRGFAPSVARGVWRKFGAISSGDSGE